MEKTTPKVKTPVRTLAKAPGSPATASKAVTPASGPEKPAGPPRASQGPKLDRAPAAAAPAKSRAAAPAKAAAPAGDDLEVDNGTVVEVPISDIVITPDKYRVQSEQEEELKIFDIARSYKEVGILQYPVVNVMPDGKGYELIAGRRRLKAAVLLRWDTIPCVVKNYNEVQAKLAVITENVIRTDYKKAEYDKAIAEWSQLYESLHPETKHGVAGGLASGARRAPAANGAKVTSKAPVKSFAATAAEQTGLARRTVEKARKRGTTFTDDDYAVFTTRRINVHDQDEIAAVTDPAKRVKIVGLIHEGLSFRKAWDTVMLPEGAKTEDVEANERANGVGETDEEFLSKCPIRGKVVRQFFDAQALVYRRVFDVKLKLERAFNGARKEFKGSTQGAKGYPAAVNRFLKIKHPKEWLVCGTCAGKGQKDDKGCPECEGTGFKVS